VQVYYPIEVMKSFITKKEGVTLEKKEKEWMID